MKVMIVVTHLLGTGHLARALTLARAFTARGHDVCVISGGMPAPLLDKGDVEIVQLAPVRSDGIDFARLLTATGPAGPDYLAARAAALVAELTTRHPDLLVTELFPFGRRILRDEFGALLDAARELRPAPVVCASIRDILAPPSKPRKAAFADEMVQRYYTAVLVHSDPTLTPLETSWPVSDTLRKKLRYTGFVAPPAVGAHPALLGKDEILVSAGGGDVGGHVYDAAVVAAALMPHRHWRLLVGGADPHARIAQLQAVAPPNVTITPADPNFRQMLVSAAASVSLCGYNTALDVLQAGTPAVFVPFDEGNEVEQGLRARALAGRDSIESLKRADLTPQSLFEALARVMNAPRRAPPPTGFDGAMQTVQIASELAEARNAD
ncbi:glycosyltransferase [uncultured Sulfitobacter sp.]|uniref:glycosyltransferase family protein n=1 Tax=uncultured Sulfitobacter sp. TaxID=191468 RepID=UPI002608E2B3|nr:glycosyltransferase [uncultured Sulfitobacter sp.]